jgi:hydrogenase maturation protease
MTLILGLGNPLRADEAVGWRVAERLNTAEAGARVVACRALVPEFALAIAAAERVREANFR